MKKILSIGYNRLGQSFFDTIQPFSYSIHSYYFNPSFKFDRRFDWRYELEEMGTLNTYGISGNILFNFREQENSQDIKGILERFLEKSNLNINAVTVRSQAQIDLLKAVNKDLNFHITVMLPFNSLEEIQKSFCLEDLHCINLTHDHLFNYDLISQIHDANLKIKLIANEGCIWRRNLWSNYFFGKKTCLQYKTNRNHAGGCACFVYDEDEKPPNGCGQGCYKRFTGEHAWLNLTRQYFTKEFLPLYNNKLDIIKITSRSFSNESVQNLIKEFTSEERSKYFHNVYFEDGITDEFINKRFNCNHRCLECNYCKDLFHKKIKESKVKLTNVLRR